MPTKFCPVCDRELNEGDRCPDDGSVLVTKKAGPATALVGIVLKGTYRLEGKIGAGGMGTVYRAVQLPLGRDVAVKVLMETVQGSKDAVKRFYREAKVLSALNHPNVVSLIDFGNTEEGLVYYVMEYLRGESLEALVPKRAPLSLEEVARILGQVCAGVTSAHATGLIHRDLKPANIFMAVLSDDSEAVKILDFGIARRTADRTRLTQTGAVVGTPGYISPEQLKGEVEPDARADIYALGAVLYFLLKGKRPYDGPSTQSIILKQLTEAPAPLDFHKLGYPAELKEVVLKAMAIDRDQRYATAGKLYDAVRKIARAAGASSTRVPRRTGRERAGKAPVSLALRRWRRAFALTVIVAALAAAAIGALALSGRSLPALVGQTGLWPANAQPKAGVRGVTADTILLGMTAAFSGTNRELGREMHLGIELRLRQANDAGGIHGRRLKLVGLDDGYEPDRAKSNVTALIDQHQVFALIGNMGTLTAEATLPIATAHQTLFFAGFTGSDLLGALAPDRYVFNFRPRYREESAAIVDFLLDKRKLKPEEVAIFAQEDSFGTAGARAIVRRLSERGHHDPASVLQVHYARNSADVAEAAKRVVAAKKSIKAVVMFATYRPAASFVKSVRGQGVDPLFISASVVGTSALAEAFTEMGGTYGDGVIVTEVVPSLDADLPAVREFRAALNRQFPEEQPSRVAFEGYIAAGVLLNALTQAGRALDTDKVVAALESFTSLDLGIGVPCTYSTTTHQCSHKVWASRLDAHGRLSPVDL